MTSTFSCDIAPRTLSRAIRFRAWLSLHRLEPLDAVVVGVGDVDVAVLVDRDAGRRPECAIPAPELSPLGDEPAGGAELLDPVVELVGDVDVAEAVDGDP